MWLGGLVNLTALSTVLKHEKTVLAKCYIDEVRVGTMYYGCGGGINVISHKINQNSMSASCETTEHSTICL